MILFKKMSKNIKKILFFPIITLIFAVMLSTKVLANPTYISLNTDYSIYLSQNDLKEYYFSTVDDYYYVIEVTGSARTTLMLTLSGDTYTDNYDGSHINAKICFEGTGSTAHIYLSYFIHYQQGTVHLKVRRMQAVLCGFDYGNNNINTEYDLVIPNSLFSSNYDTYLLTDETLHTPSYVLQNDNRGFPRIDSELFFFSGHGCSDWVTFPSGDLDKECLPTFFNCKIAVISACRSALSVVDYSFIETMCENDVETALG